MRQADDTRPELPIGGDRQRSLFLADPPATNLVAVLPLVAAAAALVAAMALLGGDDPRNQPAGDAAPSVPQPLEAVTSDNGPWMPGDVVTITLPHTRAVSVRQCLGQSGDLDPIWGSCDIYAGGHYEEEIFTGQVLSTGASVTPDGVLQLEIPVFRRLILADRTTHDCVTDGPCELVLVPWTGDEAYAPIPLEFMAGVDAIGDPRIAIDHTTDLADGEPVTLTISNIARARTLDIQLCPRDTPTNVTCTTIASRSVGGTDSETLTIAIPRVVDHPVTGERYDCAERCALRATTGRIGADATVVFASDPAFG